MKKINIFLFSLVIFITAVILFFSRQIFFFRYDPEYFENYYYNSQWNVPQSTRGLSDGELYKFVGYRLVQGENPFNINYEVPPFAKHLYGLAEKIIGNPYWISLVFYILTGISIYLICLELFPGHTTALLGLLLFVTTPFIATQIKETMLDLPLTSLLTIHALFLIKYFKRLKQKDLILAGIFLGLFTGTKIGIYTPFILLLGLVITFLSSKKILNTVMYGMSVAAGYVISFSSYFIRHPNPLPWLKLHEKPLNFYLQSAGGAVDYLNQWRGIFLNTYKGFWVGAAGTGLGDWSLILPIGVIMSVIIFYLGVKKKDYSWIYLTFLSFIILGVNTFIPFWARYLMPAVPLFIVFILYALKKYIPVILILAFLNLTILFPTLSVQNLSGHSDAVSRFLNTRAYREMYRSIDSESRAKYPENKFQADMENFYVNFKVKKIIVSITNVIDTKDSHVGTLNTKYLTDFGEFSNTQEIYFVSEHNQWKTIWKWGYLWPGFDPEGKMEIKENSTTNKKILNAVYVIPRLMYDWGKYSSALARLTHMSDREVDSKLRETIPDDFARFVGYLDPGVDPDTLKRNLLSGITIKDEAVYSSGTIYLTDTAGNKSVLPFLNKK